MFPNIDEKAMRSAMKKMGVKQEDVEASEVIIKTPSEDIIISNPSIQKINMMGNLSFQISGDVSSKKSVLEISTDDVQTVCSQTNTSEDVARKALEENNGDLAEAILSLQKED